MISQTVINKAVNLYNSNRGDVRDLAVAILEESGHPLGYIKNCKCDRKGCVNDATHELVFLDEVNELRLQVSVCEEHYLEHCDD